jgi:3'(2'), 5'-bisphosphate nucleotidase
MPFDRELQAALAAAEQASQIILDQYDEREAMADAPASISTATDRASQEAILQALAPQFPDAAFRAEEATPTLERLRREGPRMWIIDPIDGTRGFAKKNGQFSVMIALVVDGVPVVGVVQEPALGRITCAQFGGGCWKRDERSAAERVYVSRNADFSCCTLTQSHTKPSRGPTIAVQKLKPTQIIETYSAGIKLAQVARGEADVYACEYDAMNDWDIAAGQILVTEAGGRVTANDGRSLVFGRADPLQTGGLLATNALLHDFVMQQLEYRP